VTAALTRKNALTDFSKSSRERGAHQGGESPLARESTRTCKNAHGQRRTARLWLVSDKQGTPDA
jgi:hypothetical protein